MGRICGGIAIIRARLRAITAVSERSRRIRWGQMTEKYESPVNSSRSIDQPRRPRPETDQGGPRTLAAGMHKSYCESSFRVYGRFFTWQFEEPCVDGRKTFNEFIYKLIRLILSVKLNLCNFGLTYIISICFWFVIFKRRILGYEEYCIFGFENK